jgi:hypothetical protein
MIYFDKDKQAYGFEIQHYIATVEDAIWAEYAGTDKWDIIDGVFTDITDTEEYKKKKEEEEKERISHLKCTKRVLALMLQQMGISYTQLKNLIATNEQAQLEWELCVELERSNPLLDIMGQQLGITPEQLDIMFKYANGEVDKLN